MENRASGVVNHPMIPMNNDSALIDSDVLVGWLLATDALHERAMEVLELAHSRKLPLQVTNLVIAETATVLSHRAQSALAIQFLEIADDFATIFVDEQLHQETVKFFCQQKNKNMSFVDCANVVVTRRLSISRILSFDKFYRKFNLELAG